MCSCVHYVLKICTLPIDNRLVKRNLVGINRKICLYKIAVVSICKVAFLKIYSPVNEDIVVYDRNFSVIF